MRDLKKVLGCAALATLLSGSAQASLLVSDPFDYADGTTLVGQTPPTGGGVWAQFSGSAGPVTVNGGKASVVQGPSASFSHDVNVPFAGGFTLDIGLRAYASFDLTVADPGAAITAAYFATFLQGTSNFDGRIWIVAPTASGYRLAISNDNSITDNDGEVFTTDLAFGTTYKVVSMYDYDAKAARIWIDPTDEATGALSATDPGFSDKSFAYAFRQGSPSTGGSTQVIDNLLVGTTFADVTPVPEPASLSLLALAALPLARRRKRH